MAVMISTNGFVNASCIEESRNFFWKPALPHCRRVIRLNSKKSKTKVKFCLNLNTKEVSLKTSGDGGFEFKPSFDQYLQVMESVKTARKKKKLERFKIEDDDGGGGGGNGDDSVASEVKDVKSKIGEPQDETLRRRYSRQEMVSDKRNERGESGIHKITRDVKWIKSGESEDESFRRRYVKKEMVMIERGSKVDGLDLVVEDRRFQRIAKDVRWTKSSESSVTVSDDESFRRRQPKQEMIRIERGTKVDELDLVLEDRRFQRTAKDVRWTKSGESSVTVSDDESFRRRQPKQEMVRIERGSKVDELDLVVEDRRFQRTAKDVRWTKRGESSVTVSDDESFRRRQPKQEMVRYQRSSDTSKGTERGFKGDGLDLLAEEKRIERLANERHDLRRSKLSITRKIGAKKEDDDDGDSLYDMGNPAFRFSDESSDIVDKPATSRVEMEDRIDKLAKVLNGADINMPEWLFSKAIRSAKIRYTDYTIMRLIHFLGKLGNWRRVLQVIEWLQRQDRFKSNKLRIIYTTALNVLGKSRRPVEALNVFHAMLLQISSYPDMVAYRSIAVTLGQAGHIKELFHVIDTMRSPPKKKFKPTTLEKWDPRLEPDVVVYNAVLNACVQRKQWEGAFWVLQQLKQRGQKPSPVTYGLVMEVMLACEKYNLVHEFFRKMQKSSIPNALAYRVLLNTLWKEGKTDEAIQTVEDMESRGIVGSAALYYDLARCLCSAGRCNEGLNMIKKICRVANKPLVVTYTGLIQACLDSGNIKNAAYIFEQMKEVCNPNLVTCNIMLKAYLQGGLFEEARELFQKMSEDGNHIKSGSDFESRVSPDTYTFNTILDVCAQQEKWDDFCYAYREMLRHGYHFNGKRHLRMVLEASRAGKEEVMEATWEHLRRSNRIPPSPLIKERFCRKLEKGDHVLAVSCLANLNGNIEETELRAFSTLAWSKLLSRFEKDSVLRLMDDVNRRVGSVSECSDSVLGNLLISCKEFLKNRT